jgi:hypothetical protein
MNYPQFIGPSFRRDHGSTRSAIFTRRVMRVEVTVQVSIAVGAVGDRIAFA